MKIFLSWSGERSKAVALALKEWLPVVLRDAEPWLSHTDIAAGERWSVEVAQALEASDFGIICLTKENLTAPWILFEAGAVSKKMLNGAVVPYLFRVDFSEITGPLSQFQAKKTDRVSTIALVESINAKSDNPEELALLRRRFELTWPHLKNQLAAITNTSSDARPSTVRQTPEVLEELVAAVRGIDHRLWRIESNAAQVDRSASLSPTAVKLAALFDASPPKLKNLLLQTAMGPATIGGESGSNHGSDFGPMVDHEPMDPEYDVIQFQERLRDLDDEVPTASSGAPSYMPHAIIEWANSVDQIPPELEGPPAVRSSSTPLPRPPTPPPLPPIKRTQS